MKSGETLVNMAGADTIIGPNADSVPSNLFAFPDSFVFYFAGMPYTSFCASPDGWMSLGKSATPKSLSFTDTANTPVIAPFWSNMRTTNLGAVCYKTTGKSPSRIAVIEWNLSAGNFQAWLHEGSGQIDFVYGGVSSYSALIGICANVSEKKAEFCSVQPYFNIPKLNVDYKNQLINSYPTIKNGSKLIFTPEYIQPKAPDSFLVQHKSATTATFSWIDSSSTETFFSIQLSTDSIHYSQADAYISSSKNASGNKYSVTVKHLIPATTYTFRLQSATEGGQPSLSVYVSATTFAAGLSGIKKIPGDYTSITSALEDIRNNALAGELILELNDNYKAKNEVFPIVFDSTLRTSSSKTITIRPAANSNVININTKAKDYVLLFDAAANIIIDGRAGGTDSSKSLVIANDSLNGATIGFINGSMHDTIRYCTIQGSALSNYNVNYVVYFGNSLAGKGNSKNAIQYCDIKDGIAGIPHRGIYSSGTIAAQNSENLIANNNIYNYYSNNTSGSPIGIYLVQGNTKWTIENNSFYQTNTSLSGKGTYAIYIDNEDGGNFIIAKNYIGGSKPLCKGNKQHQTNFTAVYFGIAINSENNTKKSYIRDNVISNIHAFSGKFIFTDGTDVEINNNRIGNEDTAQNITTETDFLGIYADGRSDLNIHHNIIGGIISGTKGNYSSGFTGIAATGNTCRIANNTIGSKTDSNSITHYGNSGMYGISTNISNFLTYDSIKILNNTIANLTIANPALNFYSNQLAGIYTGQYSPTPVEIDGNTIYNLTTNGNAPVALAGILTTNRNNACIYKVTNNTIYGLASTNTETDLNGGYGQHDVCGISLMSTIESKQHTVSGNFVHSLSIGPSSHTNVYGIQADLQGLHCFNNIIRLGYTASGKSMINADHIYGIIFSNRSKIKIISNTVYIGGDNAKCQSNGYPCSYGWYSYSNNAREDTIMNNIFVWERTSDSCATGSYSYLFISNGAGGQHNAYINYNLYYSTVTKHIIYGKTLGTFQDWQQFSGYDQNSIFADPRFKNAQGSAANLNFSFKDSTPCEGTGKYNRSVPTDFYRNIRSSFSPTDIGAISGNFKKMSLDISAPEIEIKDTFKHTSDLTNRTIKNIRITDVETGVPITGSDVPRIWYRQKSPSATSWASKAGILKSGDGNDGIWEFTLNYSDLNVTPAENDKYEYYFVAQDQSKNKNIGFVYGYSAKHTTVDSQKVAPTSTLSYNILKPLSGIVEVGNNKKYKTLTGTGGFFEDANKSVLTGDVFVHITSDLTEPGIVALQYTPCENDSSYVITIQPDTAQERIIAGNDFTPIRFEDAQQVVIDGQYGSTGRFLRFRNKKRNVYTTTGLSSTILLSSAKNIAIKNTIVEGTDNGESLVILGSNIQNKSSENITISGNLFTERKDSVTLPLHHIIASSYGTNGLYNNIQILNNEFTNYTLSAIYIDSSITGNNWKINNNNCYHSKASWITGNHYPICFVPINSNGNEIIGNYIGGSKAFCKGSAYGNATTNIASGLFFTGITIKAGKLGTLVKDNVIRNIQWQSRGTYSYHVYPGYNPVLPFAGINILGGKISLYNDSIGTDTDTGSINLRFIVNYAGRVYGISNQSTDTVIVEKCTVGSISTSFSSNINSGAEIIGIGSHKGTLEIKNNLIGSKTVPFSLTAHAQNKNSISLEQKVVGIYNASSAFVNISGNEIANLCNYSKENEYDRTAGIISCSKSLITNNTIHDIYSSSDRKTGNGKTSAAGISIPQSDFSDSVYIARNNIYLIGNIGTVKNMQVIGIEIKNANNKFQHITQNYIHSLMLSNADSSCGITGIANASGSSLITNNMVRLGFDGEGNSIKEAIDITGIRQASVSPNKIFFNSIYIGGDSVINSNNTFALSHVKGVKDSICSNIFYNARTNSSSSTGKHYAILVENSNNTVLSGNIYFTDGYGGRTGIFNSVSSATIYNKKLAKKIDANAILYYPAFVNPKGDKNTGDLHLKDTTIAESTARFSSSIAVDFDDEQRHFLTPIDMGADAGNFTLPDTTTPLINYTPLKNHFGQDSAYIIASVTDVFGIPVKGNNTPKLFFRQGIYGKYILLKGIKLQGDSLNSLWKFIFDKSKINFQYNDTIFYFIAAENIRSAIKVGANPNINFKAFSLDSILTYPANPNYFLVTDTIKPVIHYTPLANKNSISQTDLLVEIYDSGGIATGSFAPKIYYKKASQKEFVSESGNLFFGNNKKGSWNFIFNYQKLNGIKYQDTIQYFIVAQDSAFPKYNVSTMREKGFMANNVDSVFSLPQVIDYFIFTDTLPPVITAYQTINDTAFNGTQILMVTMHDSAGIDTGNYSPKIYYRKNAGQFVNTAATLYSGNVNNGTWQFRIDTSRIRGLFQLDTVYYYIIAQDIISPPNIAADKPGFKAADVNNVIAHPAKINSYIILDTVKYTTPLARFFTNNICETDSAYFIDSSTNALGWHWDFGDGTISTLRSPSHKYLSAGTYKIELQVTGQKGVVDSSVQFLDIYASPKAIFSAKNICVTDSLQLEDSSRNANAWFWDFGDGTNSTLKKPEHKYFSAGKYIVKLFVSNNNGCKDSAKQTIIVDSTCVWPGDANADKKVDTKDILAIGIAYSDTGTIRSDTSTFWKANIVKNWSKNFSFFTNYKHADSNGDGIVSDADTCAITQNYTKTHAKRGNTGRGKNTDPVLRIEIQNDTLKAGDTLIAYIMLGENDLPVKDVYGIIFTLDYNEVYFTGKPIVDFGSSWINNDGSKLISYVNFTNQADLAITRTNHLNTDGFGKIATLKLVTDKAIGKDNSMVKLSLTDNIIISFSRKEIPVNVEDDSIKVFRQPNNIFFSARKNIVPVKVYPNPFNKKTIVAYELNKTASVKYTLYNTNGRLKAYSPATLYHRGPQQFIIDAEKLKLNKGVYILKLEIDGIPTYLQVIKTE